MAEFVKDTGSMAEFVKDTGSMAEFVKDTGSMAEFGLPDISQAAKGHATNRTRGDVW